MCDRDVDVVFLLRASFGCDILEHGYKRLGYEGVAATNALAWIPAVLLDYLFYRAKVHEPEVRRPKHANFG